MSSSDPNRNLVAALSYFLFFITGIVILMVEKEDKYIRFHAMQSIVVFGALFFLNFVVNSLFGFLSGFISSFIFILVLIVWAVSMIRAYRGEVFKWPAAGDFAERLVK